MARLIHGSQAAMLCATVTCALLLVTQVSEAFITNTNNARKHIVQKPNIIFILADDYGFNDIGYHGTQIKTPTLDQLAEEGVKLENYYVQPRCSPTRSQLMSGRYQIHTGLQHLILWRWQRAALPLDRSVVAVGYISIHQNFAGMHLYRVLAG